MRFPGLPLLATLGLAACTSVGSTIANLPSRFEHGFTVEEHAYGTGGADVLDLYRPETGGPWDAVVFFHGGRWSSGSKEDYRFVGAALARRGFLVIIPDYRKYPEIRFPAFVQDGARALAWVHDRGAALGARPGRIHVSGHSSGAHMGALLAADEAYLAAVGKAGASVVTSFAGLAGPYAFTPEEPDLIDLFGPPAAFPRMRATTFIDGGEPPMLLLHGGADRTVGVFNQDRLAERIRMKNGKVEVIVYPDLGHVGIIAALSWLGPSAPVLDDMARFFESAGRPVPAGDRAGG